MSEQEEKGSRDRVFGQGRWKANVILEALLDGHELVCPSFLDGRRVALKAGFLVTKVWKIVVDEKPDTQGEMVWLGLEMDLTSFIRECNELSDSEMVGIMSVAVSRGGRRRKTDVENTEA